MANEFVDALRQFNQDLGGLAISRATREASDKVKQIQMGEEDEFKKRASLSQLGSELALQLTGFGANPAQIQQSMQAIVPPDFTTSSSMFGAGVESGSEQLKAGAQEWQNFEQGPANARLKEMQAQASGKLDKKAGIKADDRLYQAETKLYDKFLQNPVTKKSQEVATQLAKLKKSVSMNSAAGDMSAIFAYMKMNDPESTVREGEYATAEQARGIPEHVLNAYNKAIKGVRLTPLQRADFAASGHNMFVAQVEQQKRFDNSLKERAKSLGIDPNRLKLGQDLFGENYGEKKSADGSKQTGMNQPSGQQVKQAVNINKYLVD